jgi:uncharacterized protein (DUF433 family)
MSVTIQPEAPPLRTDSDGTIRVGDSRITLDRVVEEYRRGGTPESISRSFDTVTVADVYGAIAYYLRHRDELDAYFAERERTAEEGWERIQTRQGSSEALWDRLRARSQQGGA